jgi:hypothetical protein
MERPGDSFKAMMRKQLYDVEHALNMYALSFYNLPAQNIYDSDLINRLGDGVNDCHIYLIGFVPKLDLTGSSRQDGQTLIVEFSSKGAYFDVEFPLPEGLLLHQDEQYWYLANGDGNRYGPTDEQLAQAFQMQHGGIEFDVVYVGQAYGKGGSRSALTAFRSMRHFRRSRLGALPLGTD